MDTKLTVKVGEGGSSKRARLTADERQKLSKNAERDMHSLFNREGLGFPVKVQVVEHEVEGVGMAQTHYVPVSEWLRVLIGLAPNAIFGNTDNWDEQLLSWWTLYEQHHPEHPVFERHRASLSKAIPILIHGDEGTGPKRGNFLLWTCETPFGVSEPVGHCDCGPA